MAELPDPGTFAYQLAEHLGDVMGDEDADAYLAEVVDELMLLCPGLRHHFSDAGRTRGTRTPRSR